MRALFGSGSVGRRVREAFGRLPAGNTLSLAKGPRLADPCYAALSLFRGAALLSASHMEPPTFTTLSNQVSIGVPHHATGARLVFDHRAKRTEYCALRPLFLERDILRHSPAFPLSHCVTSGLVLGERVSRIGDLFACVFGPGI